MAADLPRGVSSTAGGVSGAGSAATLDVFDVLGVSFAAFGVSPFAGDAAVAPLGVGADAALAGAGVDVTGLLFDATGVDDDLPLTVFLSINCQEIASTVSTTTTTLCNYHYVFEKKQ